MEDIKVGAIGIVTKSGKLAVKVTDTANTLGVVHLDLPSYITPNHNDFYRYVGDGMWERIQGELCDNVKLMGINK